MKHRQILFSHRVHVLLHWPPMRWFLAVLIILSLAATILQSYPEMRRFQRLCYTISFLSAFVFTLEYIFRIYAASALYRGCSIARARLKYCFSFMGMIDLISIIPFTVPYLITSNQLISEAIEFGRIFLVFKLFRYSSSYRMIQDVLASVKYELFTSLSFVSIFVSFCAVLMYYVEKAAQPEAFKNIGEGFWWAIITFTSVGYGDIYPVTPLGKLLAGGMVMVGLVAFALPTAIVSGAFINYMQEEKRRHTEEDKARLKK